MPRDAPVTIATFSTLLAWSIIFNLLWFAANPQPVGES
jgi:hypothetical protein